MPRTAVKMKRQYRRGTVPIADEQRSRRDSKASRISIPAVSVQAEAERPQHTTVLPDLRPPAEPERERPSFEERNFGGQKVARILGQYNIDMHEFVAYYDKLPRKLDLWREPNEWEATAVEAFLEHQDLAELCKDLDMTQQSAFKVITRYLVWAYASEEEEAEESETVTNGHLNGNGAGHHEGVPAPL